MNGFEVTQSDLTVVVGIDLGESHAKTLTLILVQNRGIHRLLREMQNLKSQEEYGLITRSLSA
jgi:hypothetical protein